MKFTIDRKYIVITFLKFIGCYFPVWILALYLNINDSLGFCISSLLAGITVYVGVFTPRSIFISNGMISFKSAYSQSRLELRMSDITKVETTIEIYNTVKLVTKSGDSYKLHPKDAKALEEVLNKVNNVIT